MSWWKASHERVKTLIDVSLEVMEAYLEKAKEPTSVEMKSAAVHEEALSEHWGSGIGIGICP
jgi:hypothetical protein